MATNDFLLDHLDHGFTLLVALDGSALPDALRATVQDLRDQGLPLRVIAVGAGQPVQGADCTLADANGHLRERYGLKAGGAYLLRPDQHVCARWLRLDAQRLRAALINAAGLTKDA